MDLRKRVVAAIEDGMSRNQAAKQFGVAISTAINWMKRVDETGSVAPGQIGGHKQAISGDHAVWLSQRMRSLLCMGLFSIFLLRGENAPGEAPAGSTDIGESPSFDGLRRWH